MMVEVCGPPRNADPAQVMETWSMRWLIGTYLHQRKLKRAADAASLELTLILARLLSGGEASRQAARGVFDRIRDLRRSEWREDPWLRLSPEEKAVLGIVD